MPCMEPWFTASDIFQAAQVKHVKELKKVIRKRTILNGRALRSNLKRISCTKWVIWKRDIFISNGDEESGEKTRSDVQSMWRLSATVWYDTRARWRDFLNLFKEGGSVLQDFLETFNTVEKILRCIQKVVASKVGSCEFQQKTLDHQNGIFCTLFSQNAAKMLQVLTINGSLHSSWAGHEVWWKRCIIMEKLWERRRQINSWMSRTIQWHVTSFSFSLLASVVFTACNASKF